MSVLILIPARGGSKRLPGKNLRTVGGVSLVGRAVQCGLAVAGDWDDARVICDTDSEEIAVEAMAHGAEVPFLREPDFARDDTSSAETAVRTLDRLKAVGDDIVILLQPTSPLRIPEDVRGCYRVWADLMGTTSLTVTRGAHEPNGAVYVIYVCELRQARSFLHGYCGLHAMPPERSVDINTLADLELAQATWRGWHG